ncbi:MAG: hypothetical protein NDJ19_02745 [Ramlibacter sp.]|nr:hypothetical protein [Ramlibacter sp.]
MNLMPGTSLLVIAALATPLAVGQMRSVNLKDASHDELKSAFLVCDGAATRGQLDSVTVQQCSTIYEQLKAQVFDGDFERLLAWWRLRPAADARDGEPADLD